MCLILFFCAYYYYCFFGGGTNFFDGKVYLGKVYLAPSFIFVNFVIDCLPFCQITPYTKDGINKISLTGCDARIFCLGIRIVKRRTVQQVDAMSFLAIFTIGYILFCLFSKELYFMV